MSFDWAEFLKVAEILHEGASDAKFAEAMYRIAISRAYYAAFCLARNLLIKRAWLIQDKDVHRFVRDSFVDSENKQEQLIGRKLHRLKQARVKADYDDEIRDIAKLSADALKTSREILDAIAKLK